MFTGSSGGNGTDGSSVLLLVLLCLVNVQRKSHDDHMMSCDTFSMAK